MIYGYIGSIHPLNESGDSSMGYMFEIMTRGLRLILILSPNITLISRKDGAHDRSRWASISAFSANFEPEVRKSDELHNFHL